MKSAALLLIALVTLPAAANAQSANAKPAPGSPTADKLPIYVVDPAWPPTLPNDWILGDIRGLFVDDRDHLWIIHMPSSLTPQEIGAAVKPPIADCCIPAPPVLELDPEGKLLRAWGGPGDGYTWFDHQSFRDDRSEAYASYLPAGTYEHTYYARATTPGTFVTPPAKAEQIYSPEVFGRSGTDTVTVG